jgi:hypothetical protein
MSPFDEEVDKAAKHVEAVTSKVKVWGTALLILGVAIIIIVAFVKFMR